MRKWKEEGDIGGTQLIVFALQLAQKLFPFVNFSFWFTSFVFYIFLPSDISAILEIIQKLAVPYRFRVFLL